MNKPPVCWKCGKLAADVPVKIGFRALCPHCSAALHSCVNCRYYSPGKPNDCAVPGTDFIRDREGVNFCDEFKPKIPSAPHSDESIQRARRLMGEDGPDEKKDFNSLFKD
ncbi:MAG: hypothetical protein JSS32_09465 [Verrucomicrobia bacterium]|nr:hypothetical protein [Verrucomicrobiota bacterium]